MSKWIITFVIICIAIFTFVAFLPKFVSTQMGTSFILNHLNKKIPGSLHVEVISMNWFGKNTISNLVLKDTQSNPILTIEKLEVDAFLPALFFDYENFNKLNVENANLKIIQDQQGITNLQEALGLNHNYQWGNSEPVFVENSNIKILNGKGKALEATIRGKTRQSNLEGTFAADIILQKTGDQKIQLSADHFPTLVLDQSFSISNPKLSGLIQATFGDFLEISIDQITKDAINILKIQANSPHIKADLDGKLLENTIHIEPKGMIQFALPVENLSHIVSLFGINSIEGLQPLKGKIQTDAIYLPLDMDEIHNIEGKAFLFLDPTQFKIEHETWSLSNFLIEITAEKSKSTLVFVVNSNGSHEGKSFQLYSEWQIPKYVLNTNNLDFMMVDGIRSKGNFKSTDLELETSWDGVIKEIHSEAEISLFTNEFRFPSMNVKIPFIPFQEIFEDGEVFSVIQGNLTINKPSFESYHSQIEEISIPWILDVDDNSMKLNLIAKNELKPVLRGSLRIDEFIQNDKIDFDHATLQLNVTLEEFDSSIFQPFVSSYPIKRILGPSINADIAVTKNEQGSIDGTVDITSLKSSEAFVKKVFSKLALQNQNRDITFQIDTQQAIGATHFSGTLHNLISNDKKVNFENVDLSLQGSLKHFPVGIIGKVLTGDEQISDTLEAVLGTQVDGEVFAKIQNNNGPVKVSMKGLNGQFTLDSIVKDSILFLQTPFAASFKVTPQLEHTILREYLPLLGSVASAEKPIELSIPIEGFSFPITNLSIQNLSFRYASLQLDRMMFLKESPLGKIVSALKLDNQKFEVWFTPIYFSMGNSIIEMYRTDLLVANAFPLAAWGYVDINGQQMDLEVALSGFALNQAFSLHNLNNDAWFPISIKGPIHHPKIDTATLTARISTLAALSRAGPPGKIIGSVVENATDLIGYNDIPEPTTQPLPWGNLLQSSDEMPKEPLENLIKKPVNELKKEAKKFLKGLFQ